MTETNPASPAVPDVVLLPPHHFLARRVPLAPDSAVAGQVTLALENFSPFPLDQLYHGYVTSPAQDEALVYAAYRKKFSADEVAGWGRATAVVPAFAALLAAPPTTAVIRLWHGAESLTAIAWDGSHALPVAVVTRSAGEAGQATALVAELRERTGLATAPLEEFSGEAAGAVRADGRGFDFSIATPGGGPAATLGRAAVAFADVREKEFLAERQRTGRRDQLLWRVFVTAVAGLAAVLVLELAVFGAGFALQRLRAGIDARAGAVEKIATAQTLSERVAELARRRLMPFEMIAVLNRPRPPAMLFSRVSTTGQNVLELEAQTPNAAEAGAYEAALRAAPELAAVETRDLRARDGVTTFTLTATFKPETLAQGGVR